MSPVYPAPETVFFTSCLKWYPPRSSWVRSDDSPVLDIAPFLILLRKFPFFFHSYVDSFFHVPVAPDVFFVPLKEIQQVLIFCDCSYFSSD